MILNLLKSKIHCATVTEANLQYMGSITIDEELMEKAHILPNERVQVVDNNNGARLETYTIPGPRGSGVICLNGAAARCVQPGDIVIINWAPIYTIENTNNIYSLFWVYKAIPKYINTATVNIPDKMATKYIIVPNKLFLFIYILDMLSSNNITNINIDNILIININLVL